MDRAEVWFENGFNQLPLPFLGYPSQIQPFRQIGNLGTLLKSHRFLDIAPVAPLHSPYEHGPAVK